MDDDLLGDVYWGPTLEPRVVLPSVSTSSAYRHYAEASGGGSCDISGCGPTCSGSCNSSCDGGCDGGDEEKKPKKKK
jgi:hypothetical protein